MDGLKEAHIHCDLEDNFKMPLDPRESSKIYFLKGYIYIYTIPGSGKSPGVEKQPTLVFLPGELHGERSLVDYSLWGCKKSDMIK